VTAGGTVEDDSDRSDQIPELGDVLEYPQEQRNDDRRWIVLYEEDFHNFGVDPEGNLAVLVDIEQTGEILQLAAQTLASLSHKEAEGDDVIRDMIDGLEGVLDDGA